MENTFTIRLAKNHDAKKIFEFLCELEGQRFDKEQFLQNYQACIGGNNNIYLVAAGSDNVAVGFISCHGQLLLHHEGIVYEIQELFVEKEYRSMGIGKLLVNELEENLSGRKYQSLEVTTNKKRFEAMNFYMRRGFKQTHFKFTKQPR